MKAFAVCVYWSLATVRSQ